MPDWPAYVRERLRLHGIRPAHQQDVVDDLAGQLEDAYRDALARGLSDADAVAAAAAHVTDWDALARELGRLPRLRRPVADSLSARSEDAAAGRSRWVTIATRLVHALRVAAHVRRHPGYFACATLTLAVAVGVDLVVFTVVNALWLRPLPFADPDRLVVIPDQPFVRLTAPALQPFAAVAGQAITSGTFAGLRPELRFDRVARNLETLGVTPGYFTLFGLDIRGRDFTGGDDRAGADPVAIISDRLWTREFGRRPDVIGAVVPATPVSIRIIGVAPPGFAGAQRGEQADVWIPSALVPRVAAPALAETTPVLMVFARLHPGQTPADATVEFRKRLPGDGGWTTVVPLRDVFGTPASRTIVVRESNAGALAAGLALLVLGGGCATLAALVLVHYERRRRELAVRTALGASRARLAGELSLELMAIATSGMICAILLSTTALAAAPSLHLPGGVNLARLDLSMDWRVFGAAAVLTLLTLAVAACLPVRRSGRGGGVSALSAGPAATASASSQRLRQTLLALQVAASIVVLVSAGLFVRAVIHGFAAAPGFDVARSVFATVQFPGVGDTSRLSTPEAYQTWRDRLASRTHAVRDALRALPGVADVAIGGSPIEPQNALTSVTIVESGQVSRELLLGRLFGSTDLLAVLGVPILSGRGLADTDVAPRGGQSPTVVTAALARTLWPDSNPIGQIFSARHPRGAFRYQVVGVAADFAFGSLARPAAGVVVTVNPDLFGIEPRFVLRTTSPDPHVEPIRQAIRSMVPDARLVQVVTGTEIIASDLGQQRLGAWFFSGFGLAALVLAVGGVFGLVAYLAESRRREFAVRLALGATPRQLMQRGLAAALGPVSAGVAGGLGVAALVSHTFASLLTGLSPLDPPTYALVGASILACAALAGVGAAARLRRVAPIDALRVE